MKFSDQLIRRLSSVFIFLSFVCIDVNAASVLPKLENFSVDSQLAKEKNLAIVVLVEQTGCQYCEIVSEEFLYPFHKFGLYKDKAIFRRISLDRGETITDLDRIKLSTETFCEKYGANFTPTVLFLDDKGNSLTQKILGMSSQDFYGYKLEKSIEKAYQQMSNKNE